MSRWLITGGCGFIGRNLIRQLLARGDMSIRVADNLSVGSRHDLAKIHSFEERSANELSGKHAVRFEFCAGDILDEQFVRDVFNGVDIVVHLAANTGVGPSIADPRHDCLQNVLGTLNCLEACRYHRIKKFIFASSGAPIGECEPPIHEELPAHPVSPYGASKLAGEAYCSAYWHSFGIETVALRFSNCYGPFSSHKGSVVAKYINEAFSDQHWEIFGDGAQSRDFIYVEDVAEAVILAANADNIGGEVFQIATNSETSVASLAEKLAVVLKRYQIKVPQIVRVDARVGDVRRNFSDTRKARTRLGWRAKVSLDDGLDRTIRWFLESCGKKHHLLSKSGVG
jgi:UDP-glucose 4-epimerase